jgi:segregation and condensation protein B
MSNEPRDPGQPAAVDVEQAADAAPDLQDDALAPVDALASLVPVRAAPEAAAAVPLAPPETARASESAIAPEPVSTSEPVAVPAAAELPEDNDLVPLELPRELVEVASVERTVVERAADPPGTAPTADGSALPPPASVDSVLGDAGADEAAADGEPAVDGEGPPAVGAEPLPDLVPILEALLFASDRPVTVQALSATLRAEHPSLRAPAVRAALRQLQQAYADDGRRCGRGFTLSEVAGGYVFRSTPAFATYLQRFTSQKPQRLSRAALETLAVVAYRQPVTRPQIDEVRGVESSSAVKYLLDKALIRVLGKSEEVGRPLLYGTTPEFLELFSLRSLSHLPTLQEYQ